MSLYPASNVTADTIVYINYTSGTSISMGAISGTSVFPCFTNTG